MTTVAKRIFLSLLALCLGIMNAAVAHAEPGAPDLTAAPRTQQQTETTSAPSRTVFLPTGDLFKPLLADPKEPRFYLSYLLFKLGSEKIHGGVGGYGEIIGLYRHSDTQGGYSWQANFSGAVHSQFDLHAPSLDLVNTDITIGFPFSFREGSTSYRVAIYHQSSHLGDEFLLHNTVNRIELSYEAVQALGSYEWRAWRAYYGGEYIVHQGPTDLKPVALQAGVEYYDREDIVRGGRLVGGWDLKSDQTHDWSLNSSIKCGLQFDSTASNGRSFRVLAEGYKGFAPYGQFYTNRIAYVGIGVSLGFE